MLWNIQVQNSEIQGHVSLASNDSETEVARRSIYIDKRLPTCSSRCEMARAGAETPARESVDVAMLVARKGYCVP